MPCSSCKKSHFNCDYTGSKHSRKKSQTDSNSALKARLEKLENLFQALHKDAAKSGTEQHDERMMYNADNSQMEAANRELGRLVVEDGESRYIENSFWVALCNEVN